jgi:hypothetical protein
MEHPNFQGENKHATQHALSENLTSLEEKKRSSRQDVDSVNFADHNDVLQTLDSLSKDLASDFEPKLNDLAKSNPKGVLLWLEKITILKTMVFTSTARLHWLAKLQRFSLSLWLCLKKWSTETTV